jgi:hypothetical protein
MRRNRDMPHHEMRGLDELSMIDLVLDGGGATFDVERRTVKFVLGPVTSRYAALETRFERALFRGLMEGFGLMRPWTGGSGASWFAPAGLGAEPQHLPQRSWRGAAGRRKPRALSGDGQ